MRQVDPDEKLTVPALISPPWLAVKSTVALAAKVTVAPDDTANDER